MDFNNLANHFFIYHGNYLPALEDIDGNVNYMFLPSANLFEAEDNYINLFGDLQKGNQVIDFSETEEIKSDFYILKNVFSSFYFLLSKFNSINSFYALDSVFNELVFYYFNYFVLFFDFFLQYKNYNTKSIIYHISSTYYFCGHLSNLSIEKSFFVNYSSTLRAFYKSRNIKQLSSFF